MFSFKNVLSSLKGTPAAPKRVVGIDFGSSSVKVVELERQEEALTLTSYGELQLGPYQDKEMGMSVDLEPEKKTEALVDVLRESSVAAKSGVLALPLMSSFVTVISFDAKPGEDISPRVRVEARKHIPVPIADITLDWTELSPLKKSKARKSDMEKREVLVAAIQNDIFSEMKNLMSSVNMSSQPSELELFSTLRAVTKSSDDSLVVIDVGSHTSKMYIAKDGLLRQLHRVGSGGTDVTVKIAELLGISFVEAERLKRNYQADLPQAADIKKAFAVSFERAFQEFKRLLDHYERENNTTITRTILCGGTAGFPEMTKFASYMLDREVIKANPFTKVAYPAFMEDTLIDIAPTFTVALGSALRPFDI